MKRFTVAVLLALAAGMLRGAPAAAAIRTGGDAAFVREASEAGLAEVRFAAVALRKAATSQARSFAARMRDDHSQANAQLGSIANAHGFVLSRSLDARDRGMLQQLQSRSGKAFDAEYLRGQLQAHRAAIALFQREAATGTNRYVVEYAQSMLPVLAQHLTIDKRDVAALGRDATQTVGSSGR